MKLLYVYIKKYKKFNEYEAHFNKNDSTSLKKEIFREMNITALIGENGTGKTTLLSFITKVFRYLQRNQQEIPSDFILKYEIDTNIITLRKENSNVFFRKNDDVEVLLLEFFKEQRFKGYVRSHEQKYLDIDDITYDDIIEYVPKSVVVSYFDIDYPSGYNWNYIGHKLVEINSGYAFQAKSSMGLKISVGILRLLNHYYRYDKFFVQLSESVGLNFGDKVVAYFNGVNDRDTDRILDKLDTVLSSYNLTNKSEIIDLLLSGEYFDEYFTNNESDERYTYYLFNLREYIEARSYNYDLLEQLLQCKGFYINDIFLKKNDLEYSTAEMSTGEKMLLGRICFILSNIRENSIIIIEEPEVHLNYSWIKQLVSILISLFGKYKCHFLISSHQFPFINNLLSEQVLIMTDDGVEYPEFNILMSDSDEISRNVLMNSQNLSYIESFIDRELADNNIVNLKELFKVLGESYTRIKVFRKLIELGEINVEN